MMRKRWIIAEAAVLSGLVFAVAYLGRPYPPGSGVHWANVDRVADGMSRAEAIAVIGLDPQSEQPGAPAGLGPPATRTTLQWSGDECDIWVFLDGDGRVIGRQGVGPFPPFPARPNPR